MGFSTISLSVRLRVEKNQINENLAKLQARLCDRIFSSLVGPLLQIYAYYQVRR